MDAMLKEPDDLEEADFDYSNFDHVMPADAEKLLRDGKHWMAHTAWDHWGAVWFADGKFHERVMRYSAHVATLSADSLRELIGDVNDQFGHG